MNKTIGRFYFKLTDSNNLIGEFSNNNCTRNYTESAVPDLKKPDESNLENLDTCKFIGNYLSAWYEENDHKSILAELKIRKKTGCKNIFSLEWRVVHNGKSETNLAFAGEGMICDGTLIGNYWGC